MTVDKISKVGGDFVRRRNQGEQGSDRDRPFKGFLLPGANLLDRGGNYRKVTTWGGKERSLRGL